MTPEAQRIAIAGACGWQKSTLWSWDGQDCWECDGFEPCVTSLLPRYLTDLNAMHVAENTLTREQIQSYKNRLAEVCPERIGSIYGFWPCIHATAAQRAEAFLKAIGKWTT